MVSPHYESRARSIALARQYKKAVSSLRPYMTVVLKTLQQVLLYVQWSMNSVWRPGRCADGSSGSSPQSQTARQRLHRFVGDRISRRPLCSVQARCCMHKTTSARCRRHAAHRTVITRWLFRAYPRVLERVILARVLSLRCYMTEPTRSSVQLRDRLIPIRAGITVFLVVHDALCPSR